MNPTPSFWEWDTWLQPVDFLIVGGGIVGVNAALHLKQARPKARIALLERGALAAGASTRNAGFACFGSLTELLHDSALHGEEAMLALVDRRWKGLQLLRQMVGDQAMDFQQLGGQELFLEKDEASFHACCEAMDAMNQALKEQIGVSEVFRVADQQIPGFGFKGVTHLIENVAEGQLHPGRMMQALYEKAHALGISILKGIEISGFSEGSGSVTAHTREGWELQAGLVLVATNGFARQLLPAVDLTPARNQVLITRPVAGLPLQGTFHYNQGYVYFRNVENRLLLGGGRDLALEEEATDAFGNTPFIQAYLQRLLSEVILPGVPVEVERWWSGILGIGSQKAPIVTMVSDRLGVAVRLGGMGVAIGSLVGKEAAEMLLEC